MYIGLVLRIIASRVRVHLHMSVPSLHSFIRCWSVSGFPQYLHSVVSVRWILARRSFVGMMSWMTVNHTDFISSVIGAVWTLCHTLGQSLEGCSSMIRTTLGSLRVVCDTRVCEMLWTTPPFSAVVCKPSWLQRGKCTQGSWETSWRFGGLRAVQWGPKFEATQL